jgi:hypothetical protein
LVNVASILIVPEVLRAEEASTIPVSEVGTVPPLFTRKTSLVMLIFPPGPPKAWAKIWLSSKTISFESIAMLPPLPCPVPTLVVIWLSVRCTNDPVVVIEILPPSAEVAAVVTLPF